MGRARALWLVLAVAMLLRPSPAFAASADATDPAAPWLADRGPGLPTSVLGTYVEPRQLVVYTFYEYTLNRDEEYKPVDFGFGLDRDFRARRTDHEALLFAAAGLTSNVTLELESALWTTAIQHRAADDPTGMPAEVKESGLGDTEGQLRWRMMRETAGRPELFGYFEFVFPLQRQRALIGTQDWEFAQGLGVIKGTRLGTFTVRAAVSYSAEEDKAEFGEYAVDYLKRVSPGFRWALSIEGEQDELALIAEAQLHVRPNAYLKLNNGFGLTDKAPDEAPEVGIVFSFR